MTKATLVIYLAPEFDDGILVTTDDDYQNRYTRVLSESYDWRPNRETKVGERLTKSQIVSQWERKIIPDEWVVVNVETFEPSEYSMEFTDVVIAHCERQPLSPEEVEEQSYVVEVKRPALV